MRNRGARGNSKVAESALLSTMPSGIKGFAPGFKLALMALALVLPFVFDIAILKLLILFCIPGLVLLSRFKHFKLTVIESVVLAYFLADLSFLPLYVASVFELPLPRSAVIAVLFLPIAVILLLNLKKFRSSIWDTAKADWKRAIIEPNWSLVAVLLILTLSTGVYHALLSGRMIPSTDAYHEIFGGILVKEGLTEHNRIFEWTGRMLVGYPQYTFEGFFSYFKIGISSYLLSGDSVYLISNNLLLLSIMMAGLGMYALARRIGFSVFASIIPAFILIVHPTMVKLILFGTLRVYFAIAILPITLAAFYASFKHGRFGLAFLCTIALFFHHPIYGSYAALILLSMLGVRYVRDRALMKSEIFSLLGSGLLALASILFWIYSFIRYSWFGNFTELSRATPFSYFFTLLVHEVDGLVLIVAFGGLVAVILLRHKLWRDLALLVGPLFLPIFAFLPFVNNSFVILANERYFVMLVVPLVALIAGLAQIVNLESRKKAHVVAILIVCVGLSCVFASYVDYAMFTARNQITQEPGLLSNAPSTKYLASQNESSRFIFYGDYTPAIWPSIAIASGGGSVDYGLIQADHTGLFVKTREEPFNHKQPMSEPHTAINLLRNAYVKYIFVYHCSSEYNGMKTIDMLEKTKLATKISDVDCIALYEIPDTWYAQSTELANIQLAEFYMLNDSWKIQGGRVYLPDAKNITNASQLQEFRGPTRLKYERGDEQTIIVYPDKAELGRTILVKEVYFPRWMASQGNLQLNITESELGFMLIKPVGDSPITLTYKFGNVEKALMILSLLAITILILRG